MILRGTQIQRDGRGRCDLLSLRTLPSNSAELPFSGVVAPAGMNSATTFSLIVTPNREIQNISDDKHLKPFHVARARCRVALPPPA